MNEVSGPARRSVAGAGRRAGRAVDFGVETEATGRPGVRAPSHGRTVYVGRALRPLREAVGEAIGLPVAGEVARDDPDWSGLWSGPDLVGRLVQAFADHAVGCRAGRILAPSRADRALAAAVASRLGLPLETTRPGRGDRDVDAERGPRAFLVARMLHDREVAGIVGGAGSGAAVVGGATVLGTDGSDSSRRQTHNILTVIDLSRST